MVCVKQKLKITGVSSLVCFLGCHSFQLFILNFEQGLKGKCHHSQNSTGVHLKSVIDFNVRAKYQVIVNKTILFYQNSKFQVHVFASWTWQGKRPFSRKTHVRG